MDDLLATADGGPRTDASSEELTGIMTSFVSVDLIKATHTQCLFIYMCVCVRKHRTDSNYCVKTTYGNFIVHFILLCVPSSRIFLAQSSSAVGGASLRRAADLIYCG